MEKAGKCTSVPWRPGPAVSDVIATIASPASADRSRAGPATRVCRRRVVRARARTGARTRSEGPRTRAAGGHRVASGAATIACASALVAGGAPPRTKTVNPASGWRPGPSARAGVASVAVRVARRRSTAPWWRAAEVVVGARVEWAAAATRGWWWRTRTREGA